MTEKPPMSRSPSRRRAYRDRLLALGLTFSATLIALPVSATIEFPELPLQSGVNVPPNIMFTLDDSGSMQFEITPEQNKSPRGGTTNSAFSPNYGFPALTSNIYVDANLENFVVTTVEDDWFNRFSRSPSHNASYYDPTVRYLPWVASDGTLFPNASATCALNNPADATRGCRNLTVNLTEAAVWYSYTSGNGRAPGTDGRNDSPSYRTYYPARYYLMDRCTNHESSTCYTKVEIKSTTTSYAKSAARTDCMGATCTYAEEVQNFANWYTYYRSRVLTARAGVGRAFVEQTERVRIGFATINSTARDIDGVSTPKIRSGVRAFNATQKVNFYTLLYTTGMAGGTPLRETADVIGKYFARSDSRGPWSDTPGTTSTSPQVSCRANYHILMTDGYWNGNAGRSGNVDNTIGPTYTHPTTGEQRRYAPRVPFIDAYSGTLADTAMYYWANDLRTDLTNNVRSSSQNPAFWQHVITFGVGLGLTTSVNPERAFAAIESGANVTYQGVYGEGARTGWPEPGLAPNGGDSVYNVDDLLHAAVNSRGGFFSAKEPVAFASGMQNVLTRINEREASASSVAANSSSVGTDTRLFQASYVSGSWTGEVKAFPVVRNQGGVDATRTLWTASTGIPANAGDRKIFTWNGSAGVPFAWNSLSSAQKTALGGETVLNYLRGVRTGERQNGGTLRNRTQVLGDIVNSSPAYVDATQTVYVGSNDGMLHAFSALDGAEKFAYVPGNVSWTGLQSLSHNDYTHQYFVDGEIAVSTREQTPNQSILVGALGRGGKGLYALDVTDPGNFTANKVMWEFADADLGNVLTRPVITKVTTQDGLLPVVVVGNGLNSANHRAFLFVINLETGELIAKLDTAKGSATEDNGLAAPKGWNLDRDPQGDIEYVYAGDLLGNVWKFDLSSTNTGNWGSYFKTGGVAKPMFVAKDSSHKAQPITGGIAIGIDPATYKRWIFFGTGRYITAGDPGSKDVQTWYGLIDSGSSIDDGRTTLKQRKVAHVVATSGDRVFEQARVNDMNNMKGWYIDMVNPPYATANKLGERVVSDSYLVGAVLNVNSIVPSADPCATEGTGYMNALDAYTGAATGNPYFDANGDGVFNALDYVIYVLSDGTQVKGTLGSQRSNSMITQGNLISDGSVGLLTAGTAVGGLEREKVNLADLQGRISWREIVRD
ncbi:PilC/PilY family type IV pilus protein [Lysobacter sp. LF1]|uniref:PilC/PilY family type IV pilus protein n=1 Tax=Lysobacter stagni TaxID=3045172 RepID=A0ABT6XIA3_9GAMM|nr:PilC/PilY family type IV pilus protein [Lysobacter sp. LF1]MDI9239894.1 PilC/PilY family type IV pilus protein [Lysobacter sp. LF1]